jgi:hypothetical protein
MDVAPVPSPPAQPPRSTSTSAAGMPLVVLELAGYAGAAAALAALGVAVDASTPTAQLVLGVVVTVGLLVAGLVVDGPDEAFHRMRSVFWFGAVIAWTSVATVIAGPDGLDLHDQWAAVVGALIVAALAVPLWLRERRSLQLIAAFTSVWVTLAALVVTTTTLSFFGQSEEVPDLRWSALVTAVLGVAALVLGLRGILTPRRTAMVLGSLAFIAGLPLVFTKTTDLLLGSALGGVLGSGSPDLPLWLAALAGAIVLVIGSRSGVVAVTGLGIVALTVATLQLVDQNVHDTGPAILVLAVGVVLIGAVAFLVRQGGEPGMVAAAGPATIDGSAAPPPTPQPPPSEGGLPSAPPGEPPPVSEPPSSTEPPPSAS